jgi:hypothetical protein
MYDIWIVCHHNKGIEIAWNIHKMLGVIFIFFSLGFQAMLRGIPVVEVAMRVIAITGVTGATSHPAETQEEPGIVISLHHQLLTCPLLKVQKVQKQLKQAVRLAARQAARRKTYSRWKKLGYVYLSIGQKVCNSYKDMYMEIYTCER